MLAANTICILIWSYLDWKTAWTYNNPLVIIEAALLILTFNNLKFECKIVNNLAKGAFTCYLVHNFFFKFINIPYFAGSQWYVMLLHMAGSAVGIYLVCYMVHVLYDVTVGRLVNLFTRKLNKSFLDE